MGDLWGIYGVRRPYGGFMGSGGPYGGFMGDLWGLPPLWGSHGPEEPPGVGHHQWDPAAVAEISDPQLLLQGGVGQNHHLQFVNDAH